jgi:DNA-directed RNA polymerase subunit N (RpoN/RPB10)
MLYLVCPTCLTLLGDKELIYEEEIKKLCEKYSVDYESFSSGKINVSSDFSNDIKKLLNGLVDKQCCRMRFITYCDIANLVIE